MKDFNLSTNQESARDRIIKASTKLFTERGYAGTTTRAIAELAEVNEVTLFRHFGTKEKLAKAIMDQFGGLAIADELEQRLSGDYAIDLTIIGTAMLNVMTERSDAVRMAICEAGNFPEFQQLVADNPRQLRRMLARYFKQQMDADLVHTGHPEVLAQAFLGMFFSYAVLQGFLLDTVQPILPNDEIVEQFVTIFVRGTQKKAE